MRRLTIEQKGNMPEQIAKRYCQHCGTGVEFEVSALTEENRNVFCPACGKPITLSIPGSEQPSPVTSHAINYAVLWCVIALISLQLLFPPWKFVLSTKGITGLENAWRGEMSAGYAFIFTPPAHNDGFAKIDFVRLMLPISAISIIGVGLLLTLRAKRPQTTSAGVDL
jgi:endogenous inhibitor of DNA gyrase (YacG/DUF329 family)